MGLHLIMPMGGGGTRFGSRGYDVPKPLIELQGRPFFFWAAQSVLKFTSVTDVIFVILQEHVDRFRMDERILALYPDAKIRIIPQVLNGAVLTCREGIQAVEDDGPILFNDCDHCFLCSSFYEYCNRAAFDDCDGALLTFSSNSPNYSYVKFGEDGKVIGTVEKVVASREAICGAYYFRSREIFEEAVLSYLDRCAYQEYFVSGVYNELTADGKTIRTFQVEEHISFGTPGEYDEAQSDKRLEKLLP